MNLVRRLKLGQKYFCLYLFLNLKLFLSLIRAIIIIVQEKGSFKGLDKSLGHEFQNTISN